jgi:hypothetical protein
MAKTCKHKNCNNPIFGKGCCKFHYPKSALKKKNTPLKKSYLSKAPTAKALIKKEEKKIWLEELHNWEFALWDKQKDANNQCFCFESGEVMHESLYKYNLCIYSHILPKGIAKYKKYAMEEWNVKIVKPQYHELFENKSEKAVKQLQLEKELKLKYG